MIRILLAAAAFSAAATAAAAHPGHTPVQSHGHVPGPVFSQPYGQSYDPGYGPAYGPDLGLTVYVQPRDAYVIRLDTRGKDPATVYREISHAAQIACARAPRTGNALETRPTAVQSCVSQASWDARAQFHRIQEQRGYGGYYAYSAR